MSAKPTVVELILNAPAAGKAFLLAVSVAAQKVLLALVKGDVGLGNVDNTSDANKPVSTAQATANGLRVLKAGDTMTGALSLGANALTCGSMASSGAVDGTQFRVASNLAQMITAGANIFYLDCLSGFRFRENVGFVTRFTCDGSGNVTAAGNLIASTVGRGLQIQSGTGARAGTATLVAGTVTVTNTTVTTNTRIFLTVRTVGGTLGTLSYTLSAGASFTINSSSALETSVVTYFMIEVN